MDPETGFCRYRSPFSGIDGMTREQKAQVGEIHVFTHQRQLEHSIVGTPFEMLVNSADGLTSLKKIKLTIRYSDWYGYKPYMIRDRREQIVIDPRGLPDRETAESEMIIRHIWDQEDQSPNTVIPTPSDAWGSLFKVFKYLEEVEIEMETVIGNREHFATILERALRWTFEVDGGKKVLRANRESLLKRKWQGPKCMKPSFQATRYDQWTKGLSDFQINKQLEQKKKDWENALGPVLIVASLRWTVAPETS